MAIVKHVAPRHGGELNICSAPGQGSQFRFVLPALRGRQGGAAADVAISDHTSLHLPASV